LRPVSRCRLFAPLAALAAVIVIAGAAPAWGSPGGGPGSSAPLSAGFLAWRASLHSGRASAATAGRLGLIPAPLDLATPAGKTIAPKGVAYPPTYDLRTEGRVGGMRDQSPYGTCWSFAAMSALESALLPGYSEDLSEDNLALASGFDLGDDPYDHGGNFAMTTAYFARWSGPVLESRDPYGDWVTPPGLVAERHVQEVLFVPGGVTGSDNQNIKYALMEYGAVATEICWADGSYKEATAAYYYAGDDTRNHAVAIVGWDDAFPAAGFRSLPPGDGAWLVRNNWGSGWGQGGYFWMSYYDSYAGSAAASHTVFSSVQPADNYSDIYSYDPLGEVTTYGQGLPKMWGANAFTARADQDIVAMGFYTPVPATSYTLYAGPSLDSLHAQGSGTIALPGFHTVRLDSALAVHDGERFLVAVRLVTPGTEYPLAIELRVPDYSTGATAQAEQSYVKTDESAWTDLTEWDASANVCLKAYARIRPDVSVVVDTTAPLTEVSGADALWHPSPVTLTFTAGDSGSVASGVASTEYILDGAAWTRGTSVRVATEGIHTVMYRSTDLAGNVEEARSCTVKVDTTGPTCAIRSTSAKRGRRVSTTFLVADALSPEIKYSLAVRSRTGAVKVTAASPGWRAAGVWRTWSFPCTLAPGTYQMVVRGRDLAGNAQAVLGRAELVVR
jgi:C1A family cysteine protease